MNRLTLLGGGGNAAAAVPTLSYTTNLKVQLMANAETYNNNDAMGTLTDQSGNGNNFTQATAGLKGTYKTNIINGLSAYYFPDNDRLYASSYDSDDTKGLSIFVVMKTEVDEVNIVTATLNDKTLVGVLNKTTLRTWTNGAGNLYDHTITDATGAFYYYSILIGENTGANGTTNVRQSASDKGTSGSRARGAGDTWDFPFDRASSQSFQGWIAEFLLYEEVVSGGNLTTVESYLSSKYGL